jgi:DNA-binding beta-propeller fold protein YncE
VFTNHPQIFFYKQWGSQGDGNGQFKEQHGISFDSSGHIYVVDTANQRIQVFTPDGQFLTKWEYKGIQNNEFIMPQDIDIDSSDNVYISDVGDAHPEISYVGRVLEENQDSIEPNCE